MERLDQDVKEYSYLAKYYDFLLSDKEAFNYWLKYIEEVPFKTCLELASGSGILAGILKEKGYDVVASDISSEMKDVSKTNFDGEYLLLNMIDFKLDRSFDLILCVCDSLNYLYEDELSLMFENIYKHLNKNGRFIFDMHNPKRLIEFNDEYIEEGQIDDDVYYQWTINSDLAEKVLCEHFTFYTPSGMIKEQHVQNIFAVDVVKNKLIDVGFNVRIIDDFIEDEKILFIGEKCEKVV